VLFLNVLFLIVSPLTKSKPLGYDARRAQRNMSETPDTTGSACHAALEGSAAGACAVISAFAQWPRPGVKCHRTEPIASTMMRHRGNSLITAAAAMRTAAR
jgi:hypothetical protein